MSTRPVRGRAREPAPETAPRAKLARQGGAPLRHGNGSWGLDPAKAGGRTRAEFEPAAASQVSAEEKGLPYGNTRFDEHTQ